MAKDKEYFKLLITIQIGLMLIDDIYIQPMDKMEKTWSFLFKKSIKGYFTIKEFMRDVMIMVANRPDEATLLS